MNWGYGYGNQVLRVGDVVRPHRRDRAHRRATLMRIWVDQNGGHHGHLEWEGGRTTTSWLGHMELAGRAA